MPTTTNSVANMWIKIRYSIDGPTQNIKLKDFQQIENNFLFGPSQFDDGFVGFYHKDAICEIPITVIGPDASQIQVLMQDGKYMVRHFQ